MRNYPMEIRHGMGTTMVLDPTHLLLSFKKAQTRKEVETLLRSLGLVLEDGSNRNEDAASRPMQVVNHTDHRFWVRSEGGRPVDQELFDAIEKALKARLDWIGPVFRLPNVEGLGGLLCPLPNVLVIKLASQPDPETEKELWGD